MTTLIEYKQKIFDEIKKVNDNPSKDGLDRVESMIDFYSDWYKDENGFRPRSDIGAFRQMYIPELLTILEEIW